MSAQSKRKPDARRRYPRAQDRNAAAFLVIRGALRALESDYERRRVLRLVLVDQELMARDLESNLLSLPRITA